MKLHTLDHEALDNAVEDDAVILASLGESGKVLAGLKDIPSAIHSQTGNLDGSTLGVMSEYIMQVMSPRVVCKITLFGLSALPVPALADDGAAALEEPVDAGWSACLSPPKSFLSLSMFSDSFAVVLFADMWLF